MNRDPIKPRRDQFSNGPAGNLKYLSAFVTYQGAQLVLLGREIKALKQKVLALEAKLREAEGRDMMSKHKLYLSKRA
jgi:hypothetical protein